MGQPNKLRLGSCWYRAFIFVVLSERIQTSGGPSFMGLPLNSRGARGGAARIFALELRTRAISLSPPSTVQTRLATPLAIFAGISSFINQVDAKRIARGPTRGRRSVEDT